MEQWFAENVTFVVGGVAISTVLTFLWHRFVTKHLPDIVDTIKVFLATFISNLLGMSFGESEDLVESIPLVSNIDALVTAELQAKEDRLIELKRKIVSPFYTEGETEIYLKMFEAAMIVLDGKVSSTTQEILDLLENLQKTEGE